MYCFHSWWVNLDFTQFVVAEVEFLNSRQQPRVMAPVQAAAQTMMVPSASGAPGSAIQRLLSSMTQTAMNIRRYYNINSPLPNMEEPCPCDADCCSTPMDPRRLLPVMHMPMTSHQGCCGCVDCPVSLSPMVASMLRGAAMMSMANQRRMAGQTEAEGKWWRERIVKSSRQCYIDVYKFTTDFDNKIYVT